MGHALCYMLRKSWIREKKYAVLKRPSHSAGEQPAGRRVANRYHRTKDISARGGLPRCGEWWAQFTIPGLKYYSCKGARDVKWCETTIDGN
jgi:hypothetical protein